MTGSGRAGAPGTAPRARIAVVYQSAPGRGGIGKLALDVLRACVGDGYEVHGVGPAPTARAAMELGDRVTWHRAPEMMPGWRMRYTWLRWLAGRQVYLASRRLARWAAEVVRGVAPSLCYVFTEVGLETLEWARGAGVPSIVDSPTGDIRHFRDVCMRETRRWTGTEYQGHPSANMVRRVVREYALADRVRVASRFSRRSMIERGVPAAKVHVVPYPNDVEGFTPAVSPLPADGPLRVCLVASLTPQKGYPYLLTAVRQVGASRVKVELVGGTGTRAQRRLLEEQIAGLDVRWGPVDDLATAYRRAELFVLPSLHDGWGFVVAEAMACGLPVVVTDACGAADMVVPGETGWVVPAGDAGALSRVLEEALARRSELATMGARARAAVEARAEGAALSRWIVEGERG